MNCTKVLISEKKDIKIKKMIIDYKNKIEQNFSYYLKLS